jgi:hypothetical protein
MLFTRWRRGGTTVAVLLIWASLFLPRGVVGNERIQQICAALDLHVLAQIEHAGALGAGEPNQAFAAAEHMLAARVACRLGALDEAVAEYERADLGEPSTRWLR